jgi:hypothetical protein
VSEFRLASRFGLSALSTGLLLALLGLFLGPAQPTQAALVEGGKGPQLLIGSDEDNETNPAVQETFFTNESLNRADILQGDGGNDVMFGLNGDDVIDGGVGDDIILGGPDPSLQDGPSNRDVIVGGPGDDVDLWTPGDGSEAFVGGPGLDALIFGATDLETVADEATGVQLPALLLGIPKFPQGIPTTDVGRLRSFFCTVEVSRLPGYQYLVRLRSISTSKIFGTIRVKDVEQVFCHSQDGAAIAFADLTAPSPVFGAVTQSEVDGLNHLVSAMIR